MTRSDEGFLRIGELARRSGVSPEALRAWERRYRLLQPTRTAGGFRLYSLADLRRVQEMQRLLGEGVSAGQAASQALRGGREPADRAPGAGGGTSTLMAERRRELRRSLRDFDEPAAQRTLDALFAEFDVETVLRDAILPELRDIGAEWEAGDVSVAEEHFASNVLRGRLAGLARGWGEGIGPRAVLACPGGEQHDLPLLMFGIALRRRGWRITYLGAETPAESLGEACASLSPDLVVLAASIPQHFGAVAESARQIGSSARLAIAGAGASSDLARSLNATLIQADPVSAALVVEPVRTG